MTVVGESMAKSTRKAFATPWEVCCLSSLASSVALAKEEALARDDPHLALNGTEAN